MNKYIDWLFMSAVTVIVILFMSALGLVLYRSLSPADDWQISRVLVCNGPGTPNTRLTSVVEKIRYDKQRFFEIESRGQKFVYMPGNFDTCFTLPVTSPDQNLPNPDVSLPQGNSTKD